MTKAPASPLHPESQLSLCLWDRVGSRSGLGLCHVTQAGVALQTTSHCPEGLPGNPRQKVGLQGYGAVGAQRQAEAGGKARAARPG